MVLTRQPSLSVNSDRPCFHLAPSKGWLNDPNGPLYYKGYYHLFYQHVPDGCVWSFGLVWGHSCSKDLVHWEHLPHALVPTQGSLDQDGCFSGCATLDDDGIPIILYTGVRLRSSPTCGPLPPSECDLSLPFIESQLSASPADPDDPKLTYWIKSEVPWLSLPPPNMGLGGWRDPYLIARPGQDGSDQWALIIGSGIKYEGGVVLVYKSNRLGSGWEYHGELCEGRGKSAETGIVWECPLLARPPALPNGHELIRKGVRQRTASARDAAALQEAAGVGTTDTANGVGPSTPPHFFCMSPDAPTNPSYYWLGAYDSQTMRFDLENAAGPFRLDLGDILYAPNTLEDEPNGRLLLWGWLQEKRKVGVYDYAGCMTIPRVMWLERCEPDASKGPGHGWHLHQHPIVELRKLRSPTGRWHLSDAGVGKEGLVLPGCGRLPVTHVRGSFLELELVLQPQVEEQLTQDGTSPEPRSAEDSGLCEGTSQQQCGTSSGLLLHSWQSGVDGSAALLYHWDTGVLEVIFEAIQPDNLRFSLAAPGARRVGGKLLRPPAPGAPLQLRVFLDYSVLEVYTGGGEVLTTRMYRGASAEAEAGVEIISVDGPTRVLHAAAYEMQSLIGAGFLADFEAAVSSVASESVPGSPRFAEVDKEAGNLVMMSPFKPSLLPLASELSASLLMAGSGDLPPGHSLDFNFRPLGASSISSAKDGAAGLQSFGGSSSGSPEPPFVTRDRSPGRRLPADLAMGPSREYEQLRVAAV